MQLKYSHINTYIYINRVNYLHKFRDFMELQKFLILKYLQESDLSYNRGHNILAIYCLSVQVWFVTSIQKLILNITDFALPHELPNVLKLRILGNYEILGKSQNWVGTRSRMFSLPARNNFLTIVFKNNTNTDIKVFCSCLNFLNFLNFCQIFSGYQYFRTNL